jgi:hypothetical protein
MVRAGAIALFIWALRLMELVSLININFMITIEKVPFFRLSNPGRCAKA